MGRVRFGVFFVRLLLCSIGVCLFGRFDLFSKKIVGVQLSTRAMNFVLWWGCSNTWLMSENQSNNILNNALSLLVTVAAYANHAGVEVGESQPLDPVIPAEPTLIRDAPEVDQGDSDGSEAEGADDIRFDFDILVNCMRLENLMRNGAFMKDAVKAAVMIAHSGIDEACRICARFFPSFWAWWYRGRVQVTSFKRSRFSPANTRTLIRKQIISK